jgi:hypothetical protein
LKFDKDLEKRFKVHWYIVFIKNIYNNKTIFLVRLTGKSSLILDETNEADIHVKKKHEVNKYMHLTNVNRV